VLNRLDDYPIHQTPLPVAYPATSDRNVYDRTWFNGYVASGDWYFGIGIAVYPHRGILDCAFSVVERGGRQHCFYGSRRAPAERTDMQVGPFRMEVLEPLRRTRVILDDNDSGVSCDLTFSARTAGIQEARQTLYSGTRATMDATRFDQFGRWTGTVRHPDGVIDVKPGECFGTKDRSWGVRGIGEPESGGAPRIPRGIAFMWAPLFWDDHVSHAIFFDGPAGEALVREGLTAPLYGDEAAIPDQGEAADTRMATARHRVDYHRGTRLASGVEIDLVPLEAQVPDEGSRLHASRVGSGHVEGRARHRRRVLLAGPARPPRPRESAHPAGRARQRRKPGGGGRLRADRRGPLRPGRLHRVPRRRSLTENQEEGSQDAFRFQDPGRGRGSTDGRSALRIFCRRPHPARLP
jgi:hypothetical protein